MNVSLGERVLREYGSVLLIGPVSGYAGQKGVLRLTADLRLGRWDRI